MTNFFSLNEQRWAFPYSLQHGIMRYPGGAPGVFGSLIRFTIDEENWDFDLKQWQELFFGQIYCKYLHTCNVTYARIQQDLHQLNNEEWWLLKQLLGLGNSEGLTAEDKTVDRLLRMGVVVKRRVDSKHALGFVSSMMEQVCLDALLTREIHQAVGAEDPVQLFAAALKYVNPNIIAQLNRNSPSEAVFHFEVYAVIRDIFVKSGQMNKVYPDINTRADILIDNGRSFAYELKINQLLGGNKINAAAKQTFGYKQQVNVQRMLVVNFVPAGHTFDNVYRVKDFPDFEIVHVQFSGSYDDFTISYLPEKNIPQEEQQKYVGNLEQPTQRKIFKWVLYRLLGPGFNTNLKTISLD